MPHLEPIGPNTTQVATSTFLKPKGKYEHHDTQELEAIEGTQEAKSREVEANFEVNKPEPDQDTETTNIAKEVGVNEK